MFSKSSWLHLRIPFSFFLMPVYFFALSISPNFTESRLLWSFVIIHLLLYPASNGYNSYFDKDVKSIGGLKNPPPVNKGLYYLSLLFDASAIILGFLKIGFLFASMLLIYGLVSKAYSHPMIRLKKYPIVGWLTIGIFQGFFTFVMCYQGINNYDLENTLQAKVLVPAMLSTALLLGSYPMTQVYQHEEDADHGDYTMSRMLGIKGTFYFVLILFTLASAGYVWYFITFQNITFAFTFLAFMSPVVIFFLYWFYKVYQNEREANFSNTMWLTFISALSLNAFFIYFWLETSHVGQTF
jgi:1,4-dihydroxy-2-naphthoate octaprenyltransferase